MSNIFKPDFGQDVFEKYLKNPNPKKKIRKTNIQCDCFGSHVVA